MYDLAIIGGGPAGLSAAITARARDKQTLVISNKPQNSPLAASKLVENYPGLPRISGLRLLEQMVSQARDLDVEFLYERVISILPTEGRFTIATGNTSINASAIILATGAQMAKPFAGETDFLGRGVSYCATCDGMLYRTATVCVVGLNAEAVEEANFLAKIGAKVVFLAKRVPHGLDANIMVEQGTVVGIKGDSLGVSGVEFKNGDTDKHETIPCNGVFILRPSLAPDALVVGLELAEGFIVVDKSMATSEKGVFAAGDCIGKPLQIAKAVGEGQQACLSAVEYLDREQILA
jgi:thioredoxin reductase (NADPH)